MDSIARNSPCPCGSGRKYKKCCGRLTTAAVPPDVANANAVKAHDRRLVDSLMRFARLRLGARWLAEAMEEYAGGAEPVDQHELQLAAPWALFDCPIDDGPSVGRLYRDDQGHRLSPDLRAVLDAELAAWLGVWEVQRIDGGVGLSVKDLLTGEERFVHEIAGSRGVAPRVSILARVVDCGGISFFGGSHPQALGPSDAERVVGEVRRVCRVRTRPIRPERLRDPDIQLDLIDGWREARAVLLAPRPMPALSNTDGDPLAITTDHFDIVAEDASEIIARMASFSGAEEPDPDAIGETSIDITRSGRAAVGGGSTVIGRVAIAGERLRAETNSVRRADDLRRGLESHLGPMIRFRMRDQTGPEALLEKAKRGSPRRAPAPRTAEMAAIVRGVKERYYAAWLDESIPALGGRTPKEAARSAAGRRELDLLLRDMEYAESRLPADERFDVSQLRSALWSGQGRG